MARVIAAVALLVLTSTAGCEPGRPLSPCERALYSELVTQAGRADRAEEQRDACRRDLAVVPVVEVERPTPFPFLEVGTSAGAGLGLGLAIGSLAAVDDTTRARMGVAGGVLLAVAVGVWLLAR